MYSNIFLKIPKKPLTLLIISSLLITIFAFQIKYSVEELIWKDVPFMEKPNFNNIRKPPNPPAPPPNTITREVFENIGVYTDMVYVVVERGCTNPRNLNIY